MLTSGRGRNGSRSDEACHPFSFGFAPYRLSGTVYGVLLNHAPALAALGARSRGAVQGAPKGTGVVRQAAQHVGGTGPASRCLPASKAMQIGANLGW